MENQTSPIRVIGLTLAVVLGALVLGLGAWFAYSRFIAKPALITVTGEGRVKTSPTIAKFTILATRTADSASGAASAVKSVSDSLVTTLKSSAVGEEDIKVAYARVVPQTGGSFQAVATIDATLRDITQLDNLVNRLYNAGAASITNIVLTVEDSRELEKEAVAAAITDGKTRAKEIAKASGKSLGRLVSVTTGEVGEAGALTSEAGGGFAGVPGQIEIVRQASLVFELR